MRLSTNDFLKIGSRIIVPEFQKEFLHNRGSFGFYELHADLTENIAIEPRSYREVKLKERVHFQEKFQNKLIGVVSGCKFQEIFRKDINVYPDKPVISYELGTLTHVVIVNNTDKRFILKSSAVVATLELISLGDDIKWLDKLNGEEYDGVFCPRFSLKDLPNNLQTLDDDFHIDDAFKKSLIKENKKTYESKVDMKGMGECKEMYVAASYVLEDKNCLDSFITGVIQLIYSSREYRDFLYHYNFLKIHLFPISIQDEIRNRLHIIELNEGFASRFSIAKSIIHDLYKVNIPYIYCYTEKDEEMLNKILYKHKSFTSFYKDELKWLASHMRGMNLFNPDTLTLSVGITSNHVDTNKNICMQLMDFLKGDSFFRNTFDYIWEGEFEREVFRDPDIQEKLKEMCGIDNVSTDYKIAFLPFPFPILYYLYDNENTIHEQKSIVIKEQFLANKITGLVMKNKEEIDSVTRILTEWRSNKRLTRDGALMLKNCIINDDPEDTQGIRSMSGILYCWTNMISHEDEYQLYREYRSIMEKENQTVDAITKDCGINSFTTTDLGLYFFSPTEIPGKKDKEFINSCAKRIRGILDGSIRYDNEDFYQFMSRHEGMMIELFPITIEQEILIELRLMWYDNCTLTSERDLVRSIIDKIVNKKLSYLIFDKDDKDIYDGILKAFTDSIQNIKAEIEDYDPFIYWIYDHLKICSKSRYMNLSSYMFQANELPHASEIFKIETVANEIVPYKRTNFRKYDSLPWNFTEHSVFKNTEFDNPSVGSYIKLFPFSVQAIAFIIRYRSRKKYDLDNDELFSMIVDLVREGKIGYIDFRCGNVKKLLNQNLLVIYNRSFFDMMSVQNIPIADEDFAELEQMYHPSSSDDDLILNRISSYEFIDIHIMNHNEFELYKKFKEWLLLREK